jgi:hypothetical protein
MRLQRPHCHAAVSRKTGVSRVGVHSTTKAAAALTANDVIVADTLDGKPLFNYLGPLRIVAPKDARGARSVRMLMRLELVRLKK